MVQASLEPKYSNFFLGSHTYRVLKWGKYLETLSTRISSLRRGFPLIFKTAELILALLAYGQKALVVLSFMQICICNNHIRAWE